MAVKRERLIHPLFVGLFGGAVGLSGALLQANESLIQRVKSEPPNALSIAYLEAWLRISGKDLELQSLLASQYIQAGRIDEARPLIDSLISSGDSSLAKTTMQLDMDVVEQQLWATQQDTPEHAELMVRFVDMLKRSASQSWTPDELKVLAIRAHALGLSDLSGQFFNRLAKVDPKNTTGWRELSANWALADGRYVEAAEAAFFSQRSAPTLALQREYFLRGMKIMESGNLLGVAMKNVGQHLTASLQHDPETLRVLIRMARSANLPDLASEYADRLLALPLQRTKADPQKGAIGKQQATWRVNDYGHKLQRDWIYLDGPRGNALRHQIDLASAGPAGVMRVSQTVNKTTAANKTAGLARKSQANPVPVRNDADVNADYALTYEAYVADQKLDRALDVVNRALKQTPNDAEWLRRDAVLNEWMGRPAASLQAWLKLARITQSDEAWKAVERLSVALYNDVTYIEALRHRRADAAEELLAVDQIVATYERLGEPEKALEFLRERAGKSKHQHELLERYAALAERFGEDEQALQTWLLLNQRFGPRSDYAVKIANIYSVEGKFDQGLKVLVGAKNQANANDYVYWRVLMSLAIRTGDSETARFASRHLIEDKEQTDDQLDTMIALWNPFPIDAARIAERAFRKSGSIAALQQAVYQYSRAGAWSRIDALLSDLTPEQDNDARRSLEFMLAKAEYERKIGKNDQSLATLREAVALNDRSSSAAPAYIWALIDRGSEEELQSALRRWRADAEEDTQLWGPFAAGYLQLSQEANSLHFFQKSLPTKYRDPLWQLTYAEALETFGRPDQAWDIRRQAWYQISARRDTLLGSPEPVAVDTQDEEFRQEDADALAELHAVAATLAQPYAGGDFSRDLLLQILRENPTTRNVAAQSNLPELDAVDSATPDTTAVVTDSTPAKRAATDVALAWALSNEPYQLARQWMAQRYGTEMQRPAYAEVAVALAMDDREELDRLLEQNPDRIPVLSRIEANARLDRWSEAQRLAFNGANGSPHGEELQSAVREFGLLNAHYVEGGVRKLRQAPLDFTESDLGVGLRLSDRWTLNAKEIYRRQKSADQLALVNVPGTDRTVLAGLTWRDSDTTILVEAGSRNAVENVNQARINSVWNQQGSVNWTASAGYNQEATDTVELRVGGVKDDASVGAQWRVGTRELLSMRVETSRYYDQNRYAVGKGNQIDLEAAYNIRLEYPDFMIRGVYTRATYSAVGNNAGPIFGSLSPDGVTTTADIMPTNFTQKGLLFSFGTDLMTSYTRAWRPFLEFGYLHDSRRGWGSTGSVGLAGTVFGNDHAVLYYSHDRSAKGVDAGAPASEVGVRYRWYF